MKKVVFFLVSCLMLPATMFAGLVTVEGLKAELSNPKLVILDVRTGKTPMADFASGHIPKSQLIPFSEVAVTVGDIEVEMPDPKKFEAAMQKAGVNNDSKIVVVSDGKNANSFATAPRLIWTLKNFGFNNVHLLNGGVEAWAKAKEKVALGSPVALEQKGNFTVVAGKNYPHLASKDDVKKAFAEKRDVVDARGVDFYLGLAMKPGWKQKGHIEGAKLAYYGLLFKPKSTEYLSKEELEKHFASLKINLDTNPVLYCGDGYGSMDTWFAISEILGKKTTMYDGGMFEWDGPVTTKINN